MKRKQRIAALLTLTLFTLFAIFASLTPSWSPSSTFDQPAARAVIERPTPRASVATPEANPSKVTLDTNSSTSATDAGYLDAAVTEAESDAVWILAALTRNAERAERDIDQFCELNDALKRTPLFAEEQGTRDAAPFMATRVDWEAPLGGTPRIGSLHLPETLRLKVREPDWRSALTPLDVQGLDFTWLDSLRDYDVWTLQGDGALVFTLYPATITPLPNYLLLEWHAKLRLFHAAQIDDEVRAREEVSHLAFLISTMGGALAEVMAARILALTGVIDATRAASVREIAMSAITFATPGTSAATRRRALSCSAMPCALVLEGGSLYSALRPWIDQREEWMRETASMHCDERAMKSLMSLPPAAPEQLGWLLDR